MSASQSALAGQKLPRRADLNPHVRVLADVLFAAVPLLFVTVMAWSVLHGPVAAFDFRFAYWSAGHRVLAGESPYIWSAAQVHRGIAFVYPALSALMFAPAALLTRSMGAVILTLVSACVAPATLGLLGVRDWRVYAVTLIWLPVCAGWLTANESIFMALGLAAVWRWRDRPGPGGFLTAAMISLKPLLWPLVVWLIATRRWRAVAQTVIWGVLLNAAAWSVVGFGEISSYLHVVSLDTRFAWRGGFGVPALLGNLGVDQTAGIAVMIILSAGLAAAVLHRGLVRGNEVQALTLTVALALVSSPLLWGHYLALLLVPIALRRPRFDWTWALPVLLWVAPPDAQTHLWQEAVFWIVAGLIFATLLRSGPRRGSSWPLSWGRMPQVQT